MAKHTTLFLITLTIFAHTVTQAKAFLTQEASLSKNSMKKNCQNCLNDSYCSSTGCKKCSEGFTKITDFKLGLSHCKRDNDKISLHRTEHEETVLTLALISFGIIFIFGFSLICHCRNLRRIEQHQAQLRENYYFPEGAQPVEGGRIINNIKAVLVSAPPAVMAQTINFEQIYQFQDPRQLPAMMNANQGPMAKEGYPAGPSQGYQNGGMQGGNMQGAQPYSHQAINPNQMNP